MSKLNWYENTESDIVNNLGRGGRYGPDYVADLDPEGEYKAVIVPHSKGIWRWHIIRYDGEELSGGVAMSKEEAEAAVVNATSWPGGYEQKEFDDIERQMDEKQGSRKRSAGQLTEQQAQQALDMVKQYFRIYIDKDNSPKLIMDWDWFGTGPSPSIVWEEGPYEWAIQYTGEHNRFPKGVYGEPATNWALSLYPEELDYSQNGKDDASYSEIDPEMEYWMQEFKNSSTDVELFTTFAPTFEKDSGATKEAMEYDDPDGVKEAIEIVARQALLDHPPSSTAGGRFEFKPLSLDEVIASAKVLGRAGDIDPKYAKDADNYVVEVTYADRGWGAVYEVGPTTDPILWSD